MIGEQVTQVEVTGAGVTGDRAYGIIDDVTGRLLSAKREPRLLGAAAAWRDGEAIITLPSGRNLAASDPAARTVVSSWLGRPVRLVRGTSGFVDDAPVHLISDFALRTAGDVRSFRPNVLLRGFTGDETGEPEAEWLTRPAGFVLGIGAVRLAAIAACVRCVMVTHPQRDLPADLTVLRKLKRRHDSTLGIYAQVHAPGVIALGDRISEVSAAVPAESLP